MARPLRNEIAPCALALALVAGCGGEPESSVGESAPLGVARQALLTTYEQAKLGPSAPVGDGAFGTSVALEGDIAVVGMRHGDPMNFSVGAAEVFEREGPYWTGMAKLTAPATQFGDDFGWAVALSGDTLAVGATVLDSAPGGVFVYVRSGDAWIQEALVSPEDGLQSPLSFGRPIALDGDTLVAADMGSGSSGAAYVFSREAGVWSQQARLEVIATDEFGRAVAVSGDTAVVAAKQGAYVFVRSGASWTQQAQLVSEVVSSVSIDGETAIVGSLSGLCRVFTRAGDEWAKEADLWPLQDVGSWDYFGASVAIEGDRALVGAAFEYSNFSSMGLAYTFSRQGGTWAAEAVVTESDVEPGGMFGSAVALSGDTLLIGSSRDDSFASSGGAAHVFVLVPGLPDGTVCLAAHECASGFCTDGVCCDTMCDGTCVACSSIKKGSGTSGVCEPIIALSDPDDECVKKEPGSCLTTGVCDGEGKCALYTLGTPCDDGDPCTEGDACSEGACSGKPRSCGQLDACHLPGLCNQKTGACEFALKNPDDADCNPSAAGCGCSVPGEPGSDAPWPFAGALFTLSAFARGRVTPSRPRPRTRRATSSLVPPRGA